jgi:hypothetical protein
MSNLVIEIGLRLLKPLVATLLGAILFGMLLALGESPSLGLAVSCWVAGGIFVLLVQESPL